MEFAVAVVVSQPELLFAVSFLAPTLVSPQCADGIVLCAKGHVGEVLAVFEVQVIALVAVRAVVAWRYERGVMVCLNSLVCLQLLAVCCVLLP